MEINKALSELKKGNIIVYPTETSYALGADATNPKAVEKIFVAKERDKGKLLSIIVSSLEMIQQYAVIDEKAKKLIKKFMPGPLTLIVKKKGGLAENLCKESVAFRISSNPIAQQLCHAFGKPLTATSANLSGSEPIYSAKEVKNQFPKLFVVDAGDLPESPMSTIYDCITGIVIRKGLISEEEISEV